MKVLTSLLVLFASNAFAANSTFNVTMSSKTNMACAAGPVVIENVARVVNVSLGGGYGEYIESDNIGARTVYRTLVVSELGNDCSLTATLVWNNGDATTRAFSCSQLKAQKTMTLSVIDRYEGQNYMATYTLQSVAN